ncbi:hypothetical protein BJ508DRAFT_304648 [Ascobolus immersus RN42]|uniref:Uncharacterized protein n=1 Tax=Ascobolus immersus RN42 TaxID=1160509 RepID=A0A3N4IDB3_ASCIM|nr:hypothetical protein BJ508DRAFT_304648 [Ascobolus immersus RN42]
MARMLAGSVDIGNDIDWSQFESVYDLRMPLSTASELFDIGPPSLITDSTYTDDFNTPLSWSNSPHGSVAPTSCVLPYLHTGDQFSNNDHESFSLPSDANSALSQHAYEPYADVDYNSLCLFEREIPIDDSSSLSGSAFPPSSATEHFPIYSNICINATMAPAQQVAVKRNSTRVQRLNPEKKVERPSGQESTTWVRYIFSGPETAQESYATELQDTGTSPSAYADSDSTSVTGNGSVQTRTEYFHCSQCPTPSVRFGRKHDLKRHIEEKHGNSSTLQCSMENFFVSRIGGCPSMRKHGVHGKGCNAPIKRPDYFLRGHLKLGKEEIQSLKALEQQEARVRRQPTGHF